MPGRLLPLDPGLPTVRVATQKANSDELRNRRPAVIA